MDTSCCMEWKSLGGISDLDFNLTSPFLILLFALIHFKRLKWITIPDNEGHSGSHFYGDKKGKWQQSVGGCVSVGGGQRGHTWRSDP